MTRPRDSGTNRHRINQAGGRTSNLEKRITGAGQIAFATLRSHRPITVAAGVSNQYLSMEDGATGDFETSDDTVFENAQNVALTGSPWGIKCLANGTYIVKENYFVNGGTGGAKFVTYHTIFGGNMISFYLAGRTGALIGDTWDQGSSDIKTFFEEWCDATDSDPAPVYVNPYAQLASGSDITVNVQTMVIYLGLYAGNGAL